MEKIEKLISEKVSTIRSWLIETRRNIYMYPELSGDERKTSQFVAERLHSYGMEVQDHIGGYGVIGILKGNEKGKTISWRADMDACAIQDIIDKPYKSRIDGVKHVCGHDAHTTIALGIAETLSSIKENINGTIKFIFQPWEEGTKGALRMIEDGVLESPKPDAIYGLHVTNWGLNQTYLKAGQLTVNYGAALFGKHTFKVIVKAKRKNIILSTEQEVLIHFLQKLNRYNIECDRESQNLIYFKVEEKSTVFKNSEIKIKASYRFAKKEYIEEINNELNRIIKDYQKGNDYEVILEPLEYKPSVYNDENESEEAYQFFKTIIGDNAIPIKNEFPPHGWDDFAYMQEQVGKGLFFFIGIANIEKNIRVGMHNPDFDIDEDCLEFGVKTMSRFLYNKLKI